MTPDQRKLARHALGLPNDRRLSYRNRFVAVPGTPAHADWLKMTAAGWAREVASAPPSGQSALGSGPGQPLTQTVGGPAPPAGDAFCLTLEGAGLAVDPGERLDPEDFASVDGRAAGSPERLDAGAEGAGGQSAGHA